MIDPATVEKIKATADIVEVVGDYVHLIRRGSNYMGLCPFHNERTPSFSVNKQRNFCYCFSCKKGGSPINFIMEKEGLNYHEALLHLAKRYGIQVVERELTDEERERQSEREAMFVANEWAMKVMEADMKNSEEGRDVGLSYFTHRGVTDQAMAAFHLGYAIDNGSYLCTKAKKEGFNTEVLKSLGLVGTSQQGRDYDRFRGRVIFPILNTAGKVIAFGGRDLKGGLAKYINSPESSLYKKSNELYGIFQAKGSIVSENKCFLVEGYMDVIGMWQSGMKNVVASSGTALTDGQIAMIHRFTDNISLIYDGDAAGIKASLRGVDMLLSHKMKVKVLLLPDGDDPDSFARKHSPEDFKAYVSANETDFIRYKAKVMLDAMRNDPQKRIEAVNSVVRSIAHIPDPVSRDVYIQECAMLMNIPEETIAKAVGREHYALMAKIKKERQYRDIQNIKPADSTDPRITAIPLDTQNDRKPQEKQDLRLSSQANPYYPLEKETLRYCVKYAFLTFCEYEEEESSTGAFHKVSLDALRFIKEELESAKMTFSDPLFLKVFESLIAMRPGFEIALQKKSAETEEECNAMRIKRTEEIRNADLSLVQIQKEEAKLEKEISDFRESTLREFTKEYPGRILGNDEDPKVRQLALDMVFERHHLSQIYLKEGVTEKEEDRLKVLLVRSIDEWKNETINQSVAALMKELSVISEQGDVNREMELQAKLNNLLDMRRQMAKCIGERIIFNRKH